MSNARDLLNRLLKTDLEPKVMLVGFAGSYKMNGQIDCGVCGTNECDCDCTGPYASDCDCNCHDT